MIECKIVDQKTWELAVGLMMKVMMMKKRMKKAAKKMSRPLNLDRQGGRMFTKEQMAAL